MSCQRRDQDELTEKYLRNELDSAAQRDFETHALECLDCLQKLAVLQTVTDDLERRAPNIRVQPTSQSSRVELKWAATLAGVLVMVAVVGMREMRHTAPKQTFGPERDLQGASKPIESATRRGNNSPHTGTSNSRSSQTDGPKDGLPSAISGPEGPGPTKQLDAITSGVSNHLPAAPGENTSTVGDESARELLRLGLVQPPPYTFSGLVSSTRDVKSGAFSDAHGEVLGTATPTGADTQRPAQERTYFQKAMDAYVEQRYADAIPLLEADLELEPNALDTNYYLGICRLVQRNPDDALSPLKRVAGHDESVLAQSAHFYLAKAYIQMVNLGQAETELQIAAGARGRLGAEASALLKRLQAARAIQ